jgi:uncharacterized Zn finger protein
MSWYSWRPYVPVAVRRARAWSKMEKLQKKGVCIQPVEIAGRKIAQSFWGQAWCDHLEKFSDYANRLPRGRTYVRNGSVCHLEIAQGTVNAMVSGSELYNVKIKIKELPAKKWAAVKKRCAGQIGSLLELLQGKLSRSVMAVVTDRDNGLFPHPNEISLHCSCPDWAVMCKHVAAVLYGVGARLDEKPELLFLARGVDHEELIAAEAGMAAVFSASKADGAMRIAESEISHLFGIEMTEELEGAPEKTAAKRVDSARKVKRPIPQTPLPKVRSRTSQKKERAPKATAKPAKKKLEDRHRPAREGTRSAAAAGKTLAKAKKAAPVAPKKRAVTGKTVARLRKKMKMTKAQFARLLEVSPVTISNWENSEGPLNLRARTQKAWDTISNLTKKVESYGPKSKS